MKKSIAIILFIFIAAIAAVILINKKKSQKINFKIIEIHRGNVTEKAIAIGQIVPRQDISIKAKIRGILKKKFIEVGDIVDINTPLMEVNPDPTPIEYMQAKRKMEIAKVAMDNAEVECNRTEQLNKHKWASQQEYDDCRQLFDETKLRYEMARENFELISKGKIEMAGIKIDNVIRSPIKGTVLELLVDVGDPVVPLTSYQAGTPLMTVADMTDLIFKGTVDEIDVGKIKLAIPAIITAGAIPDTKIHGKVTLISPKAKKEANSTLFNVEIEFSDTNIPNLRAGYSAIAKIVIAETNNVPIIPERLVYYSNDLTYTDVCVDNDAKIFKPKKIVTGLSDGMSTEIKNGLNDGDLIVEYLKIKP
ncbi:MAG: hypothetical protein DRI44_04515 [Chlamydiae bacterium]|nr:MAG: hypothetical protein DRI44_04515 [Chlamydiota bacterium]